MAMNVHSHALFVDLKYFSMIKAVASKLVMILDVLGLFFLLSDCCMDKSKGENEGRSNCNNYEVLNDVRIHGFCCFGVWFI
jgi:hypothetical protein